MFEEVLGHEDIKDIWKRTLDSKRVGHAYLLTGPQGIGKRKLALCMARSLTQTALLNDPDIMQIEPEKDVIKISTIREVSQFLRISPVSGESKVVIINDAHFMNQNASNSLLRILEEPPSNRHIFIVTDRPNLLPATIRSRCQKLNCHPLSFEHLFKILSDNGVEKDEINAVIRYSGGSIQTALKLNKELIEEVKRVILLKGNPISELVELSEEWNNKSKDSDFESGLVLALAGVCSENIKKDLISDKPVDDWLLKWKAISFALRGLDTYANRQLLFDELLINLSNDSLERKHE